MIFKYKFFRDPSRLHLNKASWTPFLQYLYKGYNEIKALPKHRFFVGNTGASTG